MTLFSNSVIELILIYENVRMIVLLSFPIDECDEGIGGCQQICVNTVGSYNCSCGLLGHKSSIDKIQKHFQNVMLVGMASKISKKYAYKCVDRSRHSGIKGAMTKCVH